MDLGGAEIFGIIFSSSAVGIVVTALLNRRKNKAEIESIVVDTYKDIVNDLRGEISRMKDQIQTLQSKELLYIENSNLLLKDKMELSNRVLHLEKENRDLLNEIKILKGKIK